MRRGHGCQQYAFAGAGEALDAEVSARHITGGEEFLDTLSNLLLLR